MKNYLLATKKEDGNFRVVESVWADDAQKAGAFADVMAYELKTDVYVLGAMIRAFPDGEITKEA